ncbi:aminotransferase class V-fold PLP-dependent enzyme [Halomonas denitrificans]|uniref:cysteine desulfurase family protein n=1 Tax=Halomonas denitrificans TaxID=370769 RepID=UPI001CD4093E|nr:aminotransferase class V-fold PLP-dependent enzyme [Halomonas denitrificans]MCA0975019.1 aminotransferase class V-fold PLP-dependent enzyme [Halomonas denitrificans]
MSIAHSTIYLDYAATTPVDDAVIQAMNDCMSFRGAFGNPASDHHEYGWQANDLVQLAREQVAGLIQARPAEIIFTSGATESINLALKGAALHAGHKRRHIITSAAEHKATLDTCASLEQQGFRVTYLKPGATGLLSRAQVEQAVTDDTLLVSLLHVNNETGVIQDLSDIDTLCHSRGILLHVDASQSVGKLRIDLANTSIDFMSFSAHKLYGPKGIGALYVRKSSRKHLTPILHGGGQQYGLRSGTLPTQQIVGLGKACEIAVARMPQDFEHLTTLYNLLIERVTGLEGIVLNGDQMSHFPGILNLSFIGQDGEALLMKLKRLAVSTGSACSSADRSPSHVLLAMGASRAQAHSSIRVSFGRFTSADAVTQAADELCKALQN